MSFLLYVVYILVLMSLSIIVYRCAQIYKEVWYPAHHDKYNSSIIRWIGFVISMLSLFRTFKFFRLVINGSFIKTARATHKPAMNEFIIQLRLKMDYLEKEVTTPVLVKYVTELSKLKYNGNQAYLGLFGFILTTEEPGLLQVWKQHFKDHMESIYPDGLVLPVGFIQDDLEARKVIRQFFFDVMDTRMLDRHPDMDISMIVITSTLIAREREIYRKSVFGSELKSLESYQEGILA